MINAIGRGLEQLLGLNQVRPAWREEFAAHSYRVSTDRALRVAWAVLLFDLPLFLLIDWATYTTGQWATQPAHERIFWWRIGVVVALLGLLLMRHFTRDEAARNRNFAWASAITFPLLGVWFVVVCQSLVTDASLYAMFLIGVSVLFPLPGRLKLLIYPLSLLALILGIRWSSPDSIHFLHLGVNATCCAIGALVTEAVAMRTYAADFAKSQLLDEERLRADELLRNVLPPAIVERFKQTGGSTVVEYHPEVSVLFADFVGFGKLSQTLAPAEMIGLLDALFLEFDEAADRFQVEKVKTLGDAYMAACGVPLHAHDHAQRVAELALRIQNIAGRFQSDRDLPVQFRIGLHTGPAIAGVIGRKKFCYDLWGDTINIASHLRSAAAAGTIHVSQAMREALGETFRFEAREAIQLKDRPPERTWTLVGRIRPGAAFKDLVKTGSSPSASHTTSSGPRYSSATGT